MQDKFISVCHGIYRFNLCIPILYFNPLNIFLRDTSLLNLVLKHTQDLPRHFPSHMHFTSKLVITFLLPRFHRHRHHLILPDYHTFRLSGPTNRDKLVYIRSTTTKEHRPICMHQNIKYFTRCRPSLLPQHSFLPASAAQLHKRRRHAVKYIYNVNEC